MLYTPSRWGEIFHSLTTDEALGAGSAGPGKSMVLLMEPLQQIVTEHNRCLDKKHPHYHPWGTSTGWALHLRRTIPMLALTKSRAQRIFPTIDPDAKWHEKENWWKFKSGYTYQFGHCSEKDDYNQYMSAEFCAIMYDELVQFTETQYDFINSRLRSSDPVLRQMLKIRAMSNPLVQRGKNEKFMVDDPHWVRRRFVDPAPNGKTILRTPLRRASGERFYRTRIYLPATLYDNPDPEFVRNYEEKLLAAPAYIRSAMLYGDWYVTADSFYAEVWNRQMHVCDPFPVPTEWRRFRSMDWGFKAPGCVLWWAQDPDGTLWATDELTFKKSHVPQVAAMIREKEIAMKVWKGRRSTISGPADNQLWEQKGDRIQTKASEFAAHGISWKKADKRSRERNAQLLLGRLGDHGKGTLAPGIVFFKNCVNTIRTLPQIQTNQDNIEEPADGGDDHWHDAVLYMVADLSHENRNRHSRGEDLPDDDDDIDEEPRARRGQYGYGAA